MTNIITMMILLIVISCGKAAQDKLDTQGEEVTDSDGTYMAILIPSNGKVSSHVNGEVKVIKYGDEFKVQILLKNAPSGVHKQSLNTGSECPHRDDDENRDGYIDNYEAKDKMGLIIVPLDGDLSSQSEGERSYPSGSYSYSKSTSYYLMLSDLHLSDDVSNDGVVKLDVKELPLERRVVAIYGKSSDFPSSVGGQEVPIACGVLTRISDTHAPDESGDSWDDPPRTPRDDGRVHRRRPPPREPHPDPGPPQEGDGNDHVNSGSWWDRLRDRLRRWRDRWTSGGGAQ
jgi:hypothetical protein